MDDELVTAPEAEDRGVANAAVVRKWHSRGLLEARGRRGRANLYTMRDLQRLALSVVDRTPALARRPNSITSEVLRSGTVTTEAAANLAGVSPSTVRMWVARGHLAPIEGARRPLRFVVSDVLAAAEGRHRRAMS